jgi:hypothetical protein
MSKARAPRKEEDDPPFLIPKPRAKPIYKPHSKFTPDEDDALRKLVEEHGAHAWRVIGKLMPERNSRQCRERWLNYLDPNLNTDPWEEPEDALLLAKHEKHGPRWMFLCRFFPNRTDQMIKNRFQMLTRRIRKKKGGKKVRTAGHESGLWCGESDEHEWTSFMDDDLDLGTEMPCG